jgi:hypothetical protein
MTASLTERQKAANAHIERLQKNESARQERMKTVGVIYAAVLYKAVGKQNAVEFLNTKVTNMPDNNGIFLGSHGVERSPKPNAVDIDAGWVMTKRGAYYALKATDAHGNTQILPMEPAMLAACIQDMSAALAEYQNDEGSLHRELGTSAAREYEKCLSEMAADHLAFSGKTAEIYRQSKYQAELTVKAHATAAEEIATEKALAKVESLVRRLSQAAAMPPGIERSMVLEELQPMIRRAFGG